MKQFLETICIRDGEPQHLEWHQRRVNATLQNFYPVHHHAWLLESCLDVPPEFQKGLVRCRIVYDVHVLSIHYFLYIPKIINSLKVVEGSAGMDYRYKYSDRTTIEELYNLRADADDILIIKDGWVTDTSIANIAFHKNGRWYTPVIPLLAGTTWKRLIVTGILIPKPIHQTEIMSFDFFKTINSMNDWDQSLACPVSNIVRGEV
ncbi:MAG: aminotransferase class IV family protein [Saprospiraceae bacterium]